MAGRVKLISADRADAAPLKRQTSNELCSENPRSALVNALLFMQDPLFPTMRTGCVDELAALIPT